MSPETIDALVAAGVTAEQLGAAIKAELMADAARVAERRARAAEKKRRQRAVVPTCPGDIEGQAGTDRDTPYPLPSSPQTPQQPTPTPEKTTRPRKGTAPKAYPEAFEAAWSIYPHADGRSSKPETLAQWRNLTDDEQLQLPAACARYRREGREPKADCGAPAMERWLKRGLHQNWIGGPVAALDGPVDPAVAARRLSRFRDTGVWEPGWGARPQQASENHPVLAEQRNNQR